MQKARVPLPGAIRSGNVAAGLTGFSRAGQTTLTRKRPFPEMAGVTHQSYVLASGSQAGHRFSFPITGSATWPNSGSFAKGPVYSLHCQMVAAFSSADTIIEFLQLPISNYRNILVEGNKANWFAMFSIPDTSQISSPGFHVPRAELQRGGYDIVIRYWRNSPALIFLFVKTFHPQYLFCFTLFNNKIVLFCFVLLSIQDVEKKTSLGQQQQRWLLTNLN